MTTLTRTGRPFWRRFAPLFVAGLLGIASVVPTTIQMIAQQLATLPDKPNLPVPALAMISMMQPVLLLAGAIALGLSLAPRLGLRSHLTEWAIEQVDVAMLRRDVLQGIALSTITTTIALFLDGLLHPWLPEALWITGGAPRTFGTTLLGVLYGGLTEELLMRWGVLTLLAWLGWRVVQHNGERPRPLVMWAAIVGAALIFGAGHLPALALAMPLTPVLVARTILINGFVGVVLGWLFWRRSLESAMAAHATFHVVATLVSWIV